MDDKESVERLWRSARFLPQSVRLLGTRYRALFLAYARQAFSTGQSRDVADAMAFIDFMFRQNRLGLLPPEQRALLHDKRELRRRFWLRRHGEAVSAVEKWRVLQWLNF
ncbi:MAG: hypothetical protein A3J74_08320 [Elusimicrobia bacterium RIFCSPHIGHO2_02_FULL_57_9]|nr:MAG: hypothetical protein A3J74_08320 [Elusimicrobia bacterium RIFCSPHIGHO2_02_FULL_57_9]